MLIESVTSHHTSMIIPININKSTSILIHTGNLIDQKNYFIKPNMLIYKHKTKPPSLNMTSLIAGHQNNINGHKSFWASKITTQIDKFLHACTRTSNYNFPNSILPILSSMLSTKKIKKTQVRLLKFCVSCVCAVSK